MVIIAGPAISANRFIHVGFSLPKILALMVAFAVVVSGCAAKSGESGIGKAMVVASPKRPFPGATRSVTLRLQAGTNLNAANDNRPLAAVVQVYRLRQPQRFEQAPFNPFGGSVSTPRDLPGKASL